MPLSLGFKLALGWREQQQRGELPRFEGDLYAHLQRAGFGYFEFSTGTCADAAEVALLTREAAACHDAGLAVSFHPYLPPPHNPAFFGQRPEPRAAIESILRAAAVAAEVSGSPVRIVLHPAEMSHRAEETDVPGLRSVLLRRSQEFFTAMEERLRQGAAERPPVSVAVEHQVPPVPTETVIRIGDTYEELLAVVAPVGFGLCWDTGHYLLSVKRHGQSARPPEEFLRRVEAVHLHAVVGETDHQVIAKRSSRLRGYVALLREAGFGGAVTLEYSAEAIRRAGSFERVIEQSLAALSAWLP
jgi:sugar phosphate isomerase/epimerase